MKSIISKYPELKERSLVKFLRILFLVGFILLCSIWLFITKQLNYEYDKAIEDSTRDTMNLVIAFEEHVRQIVTSADKDLLNLKQAYEQKGLSIPIIPAYIKNSANDSARFQIAIANELGIITPELSKQGRFVDSSDREFFQFHRDNPSDNLFIGLPVKGKFVEDYIIPMSRRINKPDGSFGGVAYISLNPDYFKTFYKKMNLGENQMISLVGKDWIIRTRQSSIDKYSVGQNLYGGPLWENIQAGNDGGTYIDASIIDGINRIVSYHVMPDYPFILAVGKSTQVTLADYNNRKKFYIISGIFLNLGILMFIGLMITYNVKQLRLKKELARLERLNIVGEMAASIGHEVRNPMTTVRGYLQWFIKTGKCAEHESRFQTMIEELDRGNKIITEFLSLAKNKSVHLKRDNLNKILDDLNPLLNAEAFQLGHDIKIEKFDIPEVNVDVHEIRQLILNLARNGFEAMQANNKGILTIRTHSENGKVILSVHDTGIGIAEQLIDKIGTPFFTTKENGTGLGLAVCYQIAARHCAKIDFQTSPEATTFYVKFDKPEYVECFK